MADASFSIERSPLLEGVPHGFFGSSGGAHQFGYGGPGDLAEIAGLRAKASEALLTGGTLVAPHQVHSPDVLTMGDPWEDAPEGRPVADAVVTDRRDVVLGIVTADCGPVLFADREAGIVGAAHAGWRGAHGGVLENTLAAMVALGANRDKIIAVLGPTIAPPSYEVDEAFRANFTDDDDKHFKDAGIRDGANRWHFDLPGYILARLRSAGVGQVSSLGLDTHAMRRTYYSFRRATHEGQPTYGRQLSAIAVG
ncbi:MAG: peptidoglycan editing factor PgeF [Pseudomonadota bacterium]